MTDEQNNCKYLDEFGNCEIAKIACKKSLYAVKTEFIYI